jgi:acyl carrier protein
MQRFALSTKGEQDVNSATADSARAVIAGYFEVQPDRIVNQTRFRDLGADWVDLIDLLLVIERQLPELQASKLVVRQIYTVRDLLLALVDLPARAKRSAVAN